MSIRAAWPVSSFSLLSRRTNVVGAVVEALMAIPKLVDGVVIQPWTVWVIRFAPVRLHGLDVDGALGIAAIDENDEVGASDLRCGGAAGKAGEIELEECGGAVANVKIAEQAEIGVRETADDVSVGSDDAIGGIGRRNEGDKQNDGKKLT
jgi:hypothetical protein